MASQGSGLRGLFPDLGQRTLIMGILNVTPDSFSDGGTVRDPEAALDRALAMMDSGADLIDIGGESTRPGSEPVTAAEEIARVVPVIALLARHRVGPISIDTTKAEVAERALDAGAAIVNDISGMSFDAAMSATVARRSVPVVLMHTRGRPKEMQKGALEYEDGVVAAVIASLLEAITRAEAAGIPRHAIVVDPGLGFGKTVEQNVALIRELAALKILGCPILVGPSKKSFLGKLTRREVHERGYATAASVALAIANGADFVRVHDVEAMGDVVRVADAVTRASPRTLLG